MRSRRTPTQRLLRTVQRRVLTPFAGRFGLDLRPASPEWENRPLSRPEVERLIGGATASLGRDLSACGLDPGERLEPWVREFWDLVLLSPVRQRHGGAGFNGALQLFCLARAVDPDVIVESGVFRGFTTWVLRRAVPRARLLCFDPAPRLQYRNEDAFYSRRDWSLHDFVGLDLARGLAFFDDHMPQARRIVEARERGFVHVALDDDAPAHRIHTHGGPAHPTLQMVLDEGRDGEPVRWLRNGLEFSHAPDAQIVAQAREAIGVAHGFDDLHRATGYSPARLSYVRLKPAR
jgi:hypothetical protein